MRVSHYHLSFMYLTPIIVISDIVIASVLRLYYYMNMNDSL